MVVALCPLRDRLEVDTDRKIEGASGEAASLLIEERDVFIRMPRIAPCDRCIRVGCAPQPNLDALERALPRALEAAAVRRRQRRQKHVVEQARMQEYPSQ